MKCPICGYHTLPGVATCARCAHAGAVGAENVPAGELYPPRARDRSLREDFRDGAARSAARLQAAIAGPVGRVRELALPGEGGPGPGFQEVLRPWALSCASVIPGGGQLLSRRPGAAFALAVAALALGGLAAVLIRHPVSDTLLLLLLGLCVYSVWDTATSTFPPPASGARGASFLRSLRLGLLSMGLVSTTVVALLMVLSRGYGLWSLNTDLGAPLLLPGDQIVMRSSDRLAEELRRGDIVILRRMSIRRVMGLPGERVKTSAGGSLPGPLPGPEPEPPLPFGHVGEMQSVLVPPGAVVLGPAQLTEGDRPALELVAEDSIDGRVVAIYSPPARRRWFR